MTNYGTIPTSSEPEPSSLSALDYISRAKERGYSVLAARRPWRELYQIHSFSIPPSFGEAYLRIRTNVGYFSANYAIVVLLVLFLSLLWHPISLIVFIVLIAAWLFLYFLRDVPLILFNRVIGDQTVLIALSIVTVVLLLLTNATLNVVVSLVIGLAVVLIHAAFRKTDDLRPDEEGAVAGGWYPDVGEPPRS